MGFTFQSRSISAPLLKDMRTAYANGDEITWVAFPPGGNDKYVILTKSGQIFKNGLPTNCENDMAKLTKLGFKLTRVSFTPSGDYFIGNDNGGRLYTAIPPACKASIEDLASRATITHVDFSPDGGWAICNANGETDQGGVSTNLISKISALKSNGAKIVSVTFPQEGGDTWCVVNDQGSFWIQSPNGDEPLMYMRYFSQVCGSVYNVVFDTDGNGWTVFAKVSKKETVWDGKNYVSIIDVYNNINERLDGTCTGFQCTVGQQAIGSYSHGWARTSADGSKLMMPWTKQQVASVGKFITGLATIRVLGEKGFPYSTKLDGKLPASWNVDAAFKKITFAELLTHTSGLKLGDGPQQYKDYKTMFEQTVIPGQPSPTFDPSNKSYAYSNYNFGIMRILLPLMEGEKDDADALAKHFLAIVQRTVFDPVGVKGIDAKPPSSGSQADKYSLSYIFPGNGSGHDWGDWTLSLGEAGFWVSVDDMAKVLNSLNKRDFAILSSTQADAWQLNSYGLDNTTNGPDSYRWLEKRGNQQNANRQTDTTVQILGPQEGIFGALFINSNVTSPLSQPGWIHCTKCHCLAFTGNGNGICPAGGTHTGDPSEQLGLWQVPNVLNNSVLTSQTNWRHCFNCQTVAFAGAADLGWCAAGGRHTIKGSGNYGLPIRLKGKRNLGEFLVGWKYCSKCSELTYVSSPVGKCAAGGLHETPFNSQYMVPRSSAMNARWVMWDAYANALTN